jgi:hypothetical protein
LKEVTLSTEIDTLGKGDGMFIQKTMIYVEGDAAFLQKTSVSVKGNTAFLQKTDIADCP